MSDTKGTVLMISTGMMNIHEQKAGIRIAVWLSLWRWACCTQAHRLFSCLPTSLWQKSAFIFASDLLNSFPSDKVTHSCSQTTTSHVLTWKVSGEFHISCLSKTGSSSSLSLSQWLLVWWCTCGTSSCSCRSLIGEWSGTSSGATEIRQTAPFATGD